MTTLLLTLRFRAEVALGAKTGQSRCLIDAAEREWKMSLPDPVPLSLLEGCSCLQLRNVTVGFAAASADSQEKASPVGPASSAPVVSGVKASAPAAGPSSSLGSKKVRAVAAPAASMPKVECTMVVENVTLDAHQKSKIAILGKNGCGKRYSCSSFFYLASDCSLSYRKHRPYLSLMHSQHADEADPQLRTSVR